MSSDPWPGILQACGSDCKGGFSNSGLFLVNWQKPHVSRFRCVLTSVAGAAVAAERSGLAWGSWVDQGGGLGSLSGGWA